VATRRVLTRVDDLDGGPDAHTVRFGLDGEACEIDLTDAHAQQFRDVLAPYISAGRRLAKSGRPYTPHRPRHQKHHQGRVARTPTAQLTSRRLNAIICR
jgi:hypothetical protein